MDRHYLAGGNIDVEGTQVAEAYVRFGLNDIFGVTLDVQYMRDDYDAGDDIDGWITCIRFAAEF